MFFPVTFLYGVSQFLFTALALAVILALAASYVVAMTVVPLYCARFIKAAAHHGTPASEEPVEVEVKAKTTNGALASVLTSGSTTASKLFYASTTGSSAGLSAVLC